MFDFGESNNDDGLNVAYSISVQTVRYFFRQICQSLIHAMIAEQIENRRSGAAEASLAFSRLLISNVDDHATIELSIYDDSIAKTMFLN